MKTLLAFGIAVTLPASAAMGGLIFHENGGTFEAAMQAAGKQMKFIETFEENNAPDGGVFTLDPFLTNGVPNGPFVNGIDATNLSITTQDDSPLVLLTAGFLENTSDVVGPNAFAANGVMLFDSNDKTGVSFDLWVLANNSGEMMVEVFNPAGGSLGSMVFATPGALTFVGVQTTGGDIIGSIVTSGIVGDEGELYDNIAMFTPTPGALALLGLAGVAGGRRRRSA